MYRNCEDGCVERLRDGAIIPRDSGNIDYQEFLIWVSKGNEPLSSASDS